MSQTPPQPIGLTSGIGSRILRLVGLAVATGMTILVLYYTNSQERSILAQNQRTMHLLTESVAEGVQTAMLTGNTDIAKQYAANLVRVHGILEFRILRRNGSEAFLDNTTINAVNQRLNNQAFPPRANETPAQQLGDGDQALLEQIHQGKDVPVYGQSNDGQPTLTFYTPIRTSEACLVCHGKEDYRGIIKLTTSLSQVQNDIAATRFQAIGLALAATLLILLVTFLLIRRAVVKPIGMVATAMTNMANGDLSQRVPVASHDEIGLMSNSFNIMSERLRLSHQGLKKERNKLTSIILTAREGIVVTDPHDNVVLVNPSAERLLGKNQEQLIQEGFYALLNDPDYIHRYLDNFGSDIPETVFFNNRVLNFHAARVNTDEGEVVGSTALIRDVTEEKRLEEKLRNLSITDPLTGLWNRRRLDEILLEEINRAKRYTLELVVMMLDVDHFKKFNDTHGHEMGDRLLQALARVMRDHFRDVDYPCRYGGEEFCVVMPSTGHPGGYQAAERLRQKVEEISVDGLHVTISIGLAVFPHTGTGEDANWLLKMADEALYNSKKNGRNRVTIHSKSTYSVPPP